MLRGEASCVSRAIVRVRIAGRDSVSPGAQRSGAVKAAQYGMSGSRPPRRSVPGGKWVGVPPLCAGGAGFWGIGQGPERGGGDRRRLFTIFCNAYRRLSCWGMLRRAGFSLWAVQIRCVRQM